VMCRPVPPAPCVCRRLPSHRRCPCAYLPSGPSLHPPPPPSASIMMQVRDGRRRHVHRALPYARRRQREGDTQVPVRLEPALQRGVGPHQGTGNDVQHGAPDEGGACQWLPAGRAPRPSSHGVGCAADRALDDHHHRRRGSSGGGSGGTDGGICGGAGQQQHDRCAVRRRHGARPCWHRGAPAHHEWWSLPQPVIHVGGGFTRRHGGRGGVSRGFICRPGSSSNSNKSALVLVCWWRASAWQLVRFSGGGGGGGCSKRRRCCWR